MKQALGVIIEIDEAVAVINLHVQHAKQREAQGAGDLGADVIAESGEIESENVLILLADVSELQDGFVGAVKSKH